MENKTKRIWLPDKICTRKRKPCRRRTFTCKNRKLLRRISHFSSYHT